MAPSKPAETKRAPYVKGKKTAVREDAIGRCPGCQADVNAKTVFGIVVGDPEFDESGQVSVKTESEVIKVTVRHSCDGKPAGTPETPDEG